MLPRPAGSRGESNESIERWELSALAKTPAPGVFWGWVLALSVVTFTAGMLWTLVRWSDARGSLRRVAPSVALMGAGFVAWVIALLEA